MFSKDSQLFLLYCGNSEGLATHLLSTIKISMPKINVAVLDGEYCHNVVLPYVADDVTRVIAVSDIWGSRCIYKVLQTAMLMGIKSIVLMPTALASKVRDSISYESGDLDIVEIDSKIYRFTVLHTSIRLALDIALDKVARISRLSRELDMASVVEELVNKYSQDITRALSTDTDSIVAVSRALLPAGEELMERGIEVVVLGRSMPKGKNISMLAYTSAEEHTVNEYLVTLMREGVAVPKAKTIKLNTDPLTAPLYALIIFHSVLP